MFAIGCPNLKAYFSMHSMQALNDARLGEHTLDNMQKCLAEVADLKIKQTSAKYDLWQKTSASMIAFVDYISNTFSPLMDSDVDEILTIKRPDYLSEKMHMQPNWTVQNDRIKFFRTSRNAKAAYNKIMAAYKDACEILDTLRPFDRYVESILEYQTNMVLSRHNDYYWSYRWPTYDLMHKGQMNIYDRDNMVNNCLPKSHLRSISDNLHLLKTDPLKSELFRWKKPANHKFTPAEEELIAQHIKTTSNNINNELAYLYLGYSKLKFCMDNYHKMFPNAQFEIVEFKLAGPY